MSDPRVLLAEAGAAAASPPARKSALLPETTEAQPWTSTHEIKKESNPFTDGDWRMLLYAWAGFILRVILILGAIFSVYQFLAAQEDKRIERTLALAELWERPEYQTAQRAVKARLEALNQRFQQDLGSEPTAQQLAYYQERLGSIAMTAEGGEMALPQFQEEFDRMVYLLNRVASCVETELCSRRVADEYFRDYAQSFWSYFAGYITAQRKRAASFAVGIEKYVKLPPTEPSN